MSNFIAIHDKRLSGAPGWDLDLDVVTCNAATRLSNVFAEVNRIAASHRGGGYTILRDASRLQRRLNRRR